MVQGIPEIIEIATNKRWNEDFENRHGNKAKYGWYRYNSRFAMPVIDEKGKHGLCQCENIKRIA